MHASDDRSFTARWIFPVAAPPLRDGIVRINGRKITAVMGQGQGRADVDFGNAAILPGFVNAHTHLDLTGLAGKCPLSSDFTAWLRSVIAHRRSRSQTQVENDIRSGIEQSLAKGITLLGDISSQGWSWPVLAAGPVHAVVFYELLGLTEARAEAALTAARKWLATLRESEFCRPGLSPHAPYSVRRTLFGACSAQGMPLAIHLAETRAELELLRSHTGAFQTFLEELGVWDAAGLADSPEEVMAICSRAPRCLFIHGNYLDPASSLPTNSTIVYCPRTHAAFGHDEHPVKAFLQRGVPVALGTDSLASNPDLSVLAEARFLHARYPEIGGATLLRMATLNGAEALGWGKEIGSLSPGKSADMVVVPLPDVEIDDPHALLFETDAEVRRVFLRGVEVNR